MDLNLTPYTKLMAILNTMALATQTTTVLSPNNAIGSDDMLPIIIYVLIKAKPKRIYSALK